MTGLLVSEWIEPTGGAERVLDRLAGLFPDADMLCLWNDAPARYPGREVRETWLARTPLRRHKALALPMMPVTWRVPRRGYDWALVSSHAFAHHVNAARPRCPSSSTCTPLPGTCGRPSSMRAATTSPPGWPVPPLRAIDRRASKEADGIAANSRFVADRVERAWDREATVIHPPVDVAWIHGGGWHQLLTDAERRVLDALPSDFVLGVSRFIPYKRLDVVMQTGELLGLPVVIAGHGPLEGQLREMAADASVPVHFHVQPSDALIYALMERARIFVFPPIEDFGMVAVEAMATGTPVMANRIGGSGESVQDGIGGATVRPAAHPPRSVPPQRPARVCRARGSPRTPSSSTRPSSIARSTSGSVRTSRSSAPSPPRARSIRASPGRPAARPHRRAEAPRRASCR